MSIENKQRSEPDTVKNRLMKTLFTVFACLLACALYYNFFVNTASVEVELTVAKKTDFKIYWAKADQGYSEKNMAEVTATPERKHYSLYLTDIGKVARLRIDTHSYAGEATLKELVIRQEGWAPITVSTAEQLGKLVPLQQVAESRVDNDGLWVKSSGDDSNFEFVIPEERRELDLGWLLLRLAAIAGIVFCVLYCASPLATNLRFIPVLLFGVWVLIITMAGISKENSHPDLFGIMFLLKIIYLPFVVFFYVVLVVKFFLTNEFFWEKKAAILRLILITCVGLSIFGLRHGADYLVNGSDREEKIVRLQEEMAHAWYKPGTELQKKHVSLYRKARGTTLEGIVQVDRWFEKTFRSSFGVFGYFTIAGTPVYYNLVRWSGVLLLALVLAAIFRGGGWIGSGLAIAALSISAGLIGIALYHSWTIDFQPQGRYLFPVIPIIGILYGWNYAVINRRLLILGLTPMFLLAMYSFIFEALLRIPRVVWL